MRESQIRAQAGNRSLNVPAYVAGAVITPVGVGDHEPQQLPGRGPSPRLDKDTMGIGDQQIPPAQPGMGNPIQR